MARVAGPPAPAIVSEAREDGRDAILRVSTCAICGSDLHLFDGFMPTMESGDIMGHEFMGEVVEVGKDNKALKVGDRVVIPFTIFCGDCDPCRRSNFSVCERSNRNKEKADKVFGHTTAGLFGYSHLTGGYPGGQAEYVRVPMADTMHVKVPDGLSDEQVLFPGDIFPTGWQAASLTTPSRSGAPVRSGRWRFAAPCCWNRTARTCCDLPRQGGRLYQGGAQALIEHVRIDRNGLC